MNLKMKGNGKMYKKVKGIILGSSIILSILIIIYSLLWMNSKESHENYFQTGIEKTNFEFDKKLKYYTKTTNDIKYYIPNQKMPAWHKLKLNFSARYVRSELKTDDDTITVMALENDWITLNFKNSESVSIDIDKNGTIISPHVSDFALSQYNNYKEEIISMANSTAKIHQMVYK